MAHLSKKAMSCCSMASRKRARSLLAWRAPAAWVPRNSACPRPGPGGAVLCWGHTCPLQSPHFQHAADKPRQGNVQDDEHKVVGVRLQVDCNKECIQQASKVPAEEGEQHA